MDKFWDNVTSGQHKRTRLGFMYGMKRAEGCKGMGRKGRGVQGMAKKGREAQINW
jgi:hypothetical protein